MTFSLNTGAHVLRHEDRMFHCFVPEAEGDGVYAMAVLDGHGGDEAVCTVHALLRDTLQERIRASSKDLPQALETCLRDAAAAVQSLVSGCVLTLCTFTIRTSTIHCANVGDAGAYLFTDDGAVQLHVSHRLSDSAEERVAAERRGGTIRYATDSHGSPRGPLRIWPGGLAVARSLGDADCAHIAQTPSIASLHVPHAEFSVVVASDGVWDALSTAQVCKSLRKGYPAVRIAGRAWQKRPGDDVTCIVLQKKRASSPSAALGRIGSWLSLASSSSASSPPDSPEHPDAPRMMFPVEL